MKALQIQEPVEERQGYVQFSSFRKCPLNIWLGTELSSHYVAQYNFDRVVSLHTLHQN